MEYGCDKRKCEQITVGLSNATYHNVILGCNSRVPKKRAQSGLWWNQKGPFQIKNEQREVWNKNYCDKSEVLQIRVVMIVATYINVISDCESWISNKSCQVGNTAESKQTIPNQKQRVGEG